MSSIRASLTDSVMLYGIRSGILVTLKRYVFDPNALQHKDVSKGSIKSCIIMKAVDRVQMAYVEG